MINLMDCVVKAHWFMKFDLKNGYNLIHVAAGHEWKTAFKTRYGVFEFTVMPWDLCNTPSIFQQFMNHVLGDLIDKGVIVYIDNILIYTETEEEHVQLVMKVLELLHNAGLCIALEKSVFHAQ